MRGHPYYLSPGQGAGRESAGRPLHSRFFTPRLNFDRTLGASAVQIGALPGRGNCGQAQVHSKEKQGKYT